MTYSIAKKGLTPQPVLVVRRRVKQSEIASALADILGHVFRFAQKNSIALTGLPFTRYLEPGRGVMTIEAGMRWPARDRIVWKPTRRG
jgi:hypothetical protein